MLAPEHELVSEITAPDAAALAQKIHEWQSHCVGASRGGANGAGAKLEYALSCVRGGTTVVIGHARHRLSDLKEGRVPCTRIGVDA